MKRYIIIGIVLSFLLILAIGLYYQKGEKPNPARLFSAVINEDVKELKKVLEYTPPDATNYADETPLKWAAYKGNVDIIRILLEAGSDPNIDQPGWTALENACQFNNYEAAKLLLEYGADPNKVSTSLFGYNLIQGELDIPLLLLEKGGNPDLRDEDDYTFLMSASWYGYTKIVEMLLRTGSNPNAMEEKGFTALLNSVMNGHTEIVGMLLKAGAEPDLRKDKGEFTPLMYAVLDGHTEIVKLLLDAGADVSEVWFDGSTALEMAEDKGYTEIINLLLEAGADPRLLKFLT